MRSRTLRVPSRPFFSSARAILLVASFTTAIASLIGCSSDDSKTTEPPMPPEDPEPLGIEFLEGGGGCGDQETFDAYLLFQYNTDYSAALVIRLQPSALTDGWQLLPAWARVHRFAEPDPTYYCDDVGPFPEYVETWRAIEGGMWVYLGPVASPHDETRTVEVLLHDVTVENEDTSELRSLPSRTLKATVGWIPG
ncbi:MAG: hypothetical protein KDA27_27605 [Candidatus Eisenbacteria bacterium]|uniref:Lipoprotein n=1 Tax=Eiseniibacteriota bacterium TaxID=2212470 RepID=A0A956SIJ1_UNCEI|nr:hypothetical protein [Candidatus Eisenbacteria bacterium]